MWTYSQNTGWLVDAAGKHIARGYSGTGQGKNNGSMQSAHNVGPIPQGIFHPEQPVNSAKHGPFAIPLTPKPENMMYGRSEFMMHGDSIAHPGNASEGCIIMPRFAREAFYQSLEELQVIS